MDDGGVAADRAVAVGADRDRWVLSGLNDGWRKPALAAAWGLAWVAGRLVSRPITASVRRSAVEVVIGLRGKGRLRVQSRRLLLDKLPPPHHKESPVRRLTIRFDQISHVEAGVLHTPAQWWLGNTSELPLTLARCCGSSAAGRSGCCPPTLSSRRDVWSWNAGKARAKAYPRPPLESGRWANAKKLWDLDRVQPMQPNQEKVSTGCTV